MDEEILSAEIDEDLFVEGEDIDESIERHFAVVQAVFEDGLQLKFDNGSISQKHYKCNAQCYFRAGDRVRIISDSGTYVVEYPVGSPLGAKPIYVPSGGAQGQVLTKTATGSDSLGWRDVPTELPATGNVGQWLQKTTAGVQWADKPKSDLPTGGSNGQVLTMGSSSPEWKDVPKELPSTGTTGHYLKKTSSGSEWAAVDSALPSGGSTGQVLTKTSTGSSWQDAPKELPASGTTGHYLKKTSSGVEWAAVSGGDSDTDRLYVGSTNYITLNSSRALVPHASSSSYPYSLGSSSYPFYNLYTGAGTIQLGSSSYSSGSKIGFYGGTPQIRKTLSTSTKNQNYSSVTDSNIVTAVNNLIGILKSCGFIDA